MSSSFGLTQHATHLLIDLTNTRNVLIIVAFDNVDNFLLLVGKLILYLFDESIGLRDQFFAQTEVNTLEPLDFCIHIIDSLLHHLVK